jgi:hypothetical protein
MLKRTCFMITALASLLSSDPYLSDPFDGGYHLDIAQFDSGLVGSWMYVGVGFEHADVRCRMSGFQPSKDVPVQAFARFGYRVHTSLQFAFDLCGEISLNEKNTHNILSDLNYLYFVQTSYDQPPTVYFGIGGPINVKSLMKLLQRINLKDLCFSNFILGKRLDSKKFVQVKINDFRHLDYHKQRLYLPSLQKLTKNMIFEIGVGF